MLAAQLDQEMAAVAEKARSGLVHVQNVGGGVGSGIVLHPGGLIVTNSHVVGNGGLKVMLPNGEVLPARLLARDPDSDLAALAANVNGHSALSLGDSQRLRAGEWVMAVGNPWGVSGAATVGVVIGMGSDLPEMGRSNKDWIAAGLRLRPGNSGGPLLDASGRVVGINTMVTGPAVGMAMPSHTVKLFLRRHLGSADRTPTVD